MTQQPDGSRIRSHIMVVLATLIWGFNNIAMKIAYREIDPWMFNGIRLAAVLPFVLIAARRMPGYRPFVALLPNALEGTILHLEVVQHLRPRAARELFATHSAYSSRIEYLARGLVRFPCFTFVE